MNKKIITIVGFCSIPFGALLFNACGPELDEKNNELALDQASDNYTDWGRCNTFFDTDGDGLIAGHDPDCQFLGPIRDLSTMPYPIGHNFYPDITLIPRGSPGYPGGFRDRDQMVRWFRFLTEADGYVAGITIAGPGVNPGAVPIPMPLNALSRQGTAAQGNNNNVPLEALHNSVLDHGFLPGSPTKTGADGSSGAASLEYDAGILKKPYGDPIGRFPGAFYRSAKGPYGGMAGSQGALQYGSKTGNPDTDSAPVEPQ